MTIEDLTYNELTTLVSRFSSSITQLKNTGDYPEAKRDQLLLQKLINLQFIQLKMRTT